MEISQETADFVVFIAMWYVGMIVYSCNALVKMVRPSASYAARRVYQSAFAASPAATEAAVVFCVELALPLLWVSFEACMDKLAIFLEPFVIPVLVLLCAGCPPSQHVTSFITHTTDDITLDSTDLNTSLIRSITTAVATTTNSSSSATNQQTSMCDTSASPCALSPRSSTSSLMCDDHLLLSSEPSSSAAPSCDSSCGTTPRASDGEDTLFKAQPTITLEVGACGMMDANHSMVPWAPRPAGAVWGDVGVYTVSAISKEEVKATLTSQIYSECLMVDESEPCGCFGRPFLVPMSGIPAPELSSSSEVAAAKAEALRPAAICSAIERTVYDALFC